MKNSVTVSSYEKDANDFLKSVGAKLTVKFLSHDYFWPDDKDCRDIYQFRLSRNGKSYTAKFGQSINGSQNGEVPNAYDILTCLTKYEVGTFANFCGDFGYDQDSPKAEKTYKAVLKEFDGVSRVFGDVLEQLQEIQ
jgi:hypothetical protein